MNAFRMWRRPLRPLRSALPPLLPIFATVASAHADESPLVGIEQWGNLDDGRAVTLYRLTNQRGMEVRLTDLGAAIVAVRVPEAEGLHDVVVGPEIFPEFVRSRKRFGAVVGRYAGRLGRSVVIDGKRYDLDARPNGVTLHAGDPGLDRALWRGRSFRSARGLGVEFRTISPDGSQRLPGNLTVVARYTLDWAKNALTLEFEASSDRSTVVNLTNHAYFNLSDQPTIAGHCLAVDSRREVAVDERKLPGGALRSLVGTDRDFGKWRLLGAFQPTGIDTMFVLDRKRARLRDPQSGRSLTITTSQPGLQVFTGNTFDSSEPDGQGRPIPRFGGVALETQHFPDSPNIPAFPSTMVRPAQPLRQWTRWKFSRSGSNGNNSCE